MKIFAISDLHGYLPDIPACDLLLLGGDYCASRNIEQQKRHLQISMKRWFEYLIEELSVKQIVGIGGNHDFMLQDDPSIAEDLPWIYLQDAGVEIDGIKIYGTPWTPIYGHWAFMKDDSKLEHVFNNIPGGLDILLSHGPIMGVLDRNEEGKSCGSRSLWRKVQQCQPRQMIHGHIHEAHGTYRVGGTMFNNVSHVNRQCEPVHEAMEIFL
jgi:Icc-related predicted phosphoesterase